MSALELTDPEIPTLLAGDLNCRMDRPNSKSQALMELMEEVSFTLTNAAQTKTYISHNGSSTIDLIFYQGNELKLQSITITAVSASNPIRKHLPVRAKFQIMTIKKDKQSNQRWTPRKISLDLLLRITGTIPHNL